MLLIGARLISVCVACVVRFPVLRHLRVTDTSCKSLAEVAIAQDRLIDGCQGRSCLWECGLWLSVTWAWVRSALRKSLQYWILTTRSKCLPSDHATSVYQTRVSPGTFSLFSIRLYGKLRNQRRSAHRGRWRDRGRLFQRADPHQSNDDQ